MYSSHYRNIVTTLCKLYSTAVHHRVAPVHTSCSYTVQCTMYSSISELYTVLYVAADKQGHYSLFKTRRVSKSEAKFFVIMCSLVQGYFYKIKMNITSNKEIFNNDLEFIRIIFVKLRVKNVEKWQ